MINRTTLTEDSRRDLLNRSKRGDDYSETNRSLGKNRYERRVHSRVSSSTKEYNKMDMNKLFKDNIIDVGILVNGETSEYTVRLVWGGFLSSLKLYTENLETDIVDLRIIIRALVDSFNHNDVFIHCSCPDWRYRMDYWAHANDISSVEKTDDPLDRPSDITNPNDTLGAGCKHTLLVLNNTSWIVKVASVINNYIKYMEKHKPYLYQTVIYPALFEREWEEVQLEIEPETELADTINNEPEDENELDTSNKWAKIKSQFKADNEYKFKPKDDAIDNQKEFDLDSLEKENQ